MKTLTKEQEQYLSDDMYLPIHYRGIKVNQPFYEGDGILSVDKLQKLCNQFQEYCHQQAVIKQHLKNIVVELKFGVESSDK